MHAYDFVLIWARSLSYAMRLRSCRVRVNRCVYVQFGCTRTLGVVIS